MHIESIPLSLSRLKKSNHILILSRFSLKCHVRKHYLRLCGIYHKCLISNINKSLFPFTFKFVNNLYSEFLSLQVQDFHVRRYTLSSFLSNFITGMPLSECTFIANPGYSLTGSFHTNISPKSVVLTQLPSFLSCNYSLSIISFNRNISSF